MEKKLELHVIIRDVLIRFQNERLGALEITRPPVNCPDEPEGDGLSRREMVGKLALILAGAAAFKLQGCGACNDFSVQQTDSGIDAGDAGKDGCTLSDCTTDCEAGDCGTSDSCGTADCTTAEGCGATDCAATDCAATDCGSTDTTTCAATDCGSTDTTTCDCGTESSFF